MHVFLFLLILLAFPVLEIWLLIELADSYGWGVLAYLIVVAVLGWRLIQDEKLVVFGRAAQTLSQGGTPARVLFGSAKNMIAGILLIIPGVITDAFAVLLLLIPTPKPLNFDQDINQGFETRTQRRGGRNKAANDDVIEGEFKRED
jgi:UPF0716 protein FxsA